MISLRKIALRHIFSQTELEEFVLQSDFQHKAIGGDILIDDKYTNDVVEQFKAWQANKREQETRQAEERAQERAEQAKLDAEEDDRMQAAFSKMLITSGFSFEGYRITKYSGYISGDDAIEVPRGTAGLFGYSLAETKVGDALMASLTQIRRNALRELKEAAYHLGCNAVIGVDFDYITLDPVTANAAGGTTYLPYVFGVTANGNAVVIEKIE